MKTRTVRVLLSTYNGEKYLKEQLDSILMQEDRGVSVSILVRDDGSSDHTQEILSAYAKKFKNFSWYTGKHKGAAGSFYDLLLRTDTIADYYAFADQDDVWHQEKLVRAVRKLIQESKRMDYVDQPILYAGKVICASQNLEKQERVYYRIGKNASFGNALVENICMGCTEVFNLELLMLVRKHLPGSNIMHDWWMYLTAAYFGKVIFDQQAYMLYRQHENNEVGMQNCRRLRWRNRIVHVRKIKHKLSGQASEFQEVYTGVPAMSREDEGRLEQMCRYRDSVYKRICMAVTSGIYRQNRMDDLVFRLLILIGYL